MSYPCNKCFGERTIMYSNTSTWRGGIGGAAITEDVCNSCWGSGIQGEPWTNLRELEAYWKQQVHDASLQSFARAAGAGYQFLRPDLDALCVEIEKLSRKRKPPTRNFVTVCELLIKALKP